MVLSGLPFRPGQRVEVVMLAEEEIAPLPEKLRRLLRATQELPSARSLSDEEIREEVAAYRARR